MKYSLAKQLLSEDIEKMTLEQVQKHKVRLIDAWRHSKAAYGMALAIKEGFYLEVVDSGASGYTPRDIWLTHQITARMEQTEERESKLLQHNL